MFCPACKSEYRAGFARCATCDVDLVDSLGAESGSASRESTDVEPRDAGPMMDFCGFLGIEDARDARNRLWNEGIRSEIVIRDAPGSALGGALTEEFWIRVGMKQLRRVADLLGYDTAEGLDTEGAGDLRCSSCGYAVSPEETFCPQCGARFGD